MRGEDAWYATTWPDMPGGDGLIVRVMQGRAKKIAGNPDHPVNRGKQSARHDAAIQLTYHPDRISEPMMRQSKGRFVTTRFRGHALSRSCRQRLRPARTTWRS